MNRTSPMVRLLVLFGEVENCILDTVRAGLPLGPERDHTPKVLLLVPFAPKMNNPSKTALRLFGRPALTAPTGLVAPGGDPGPLRAPGSPSQPGRCSPARRAVDAVALAVWRHAPKSLRNLPRFRDAVLLRASRHANRAER